MYIGQISLTAYNFQRTSNFFNLIKTKNYVERV